MKLIIDTSEEDLDCIKYLKVKGWASRNELQILNGTPLDDVLGKIRAEIIQMPTISLNANDIYKADVLAIIDKYKAEREE